MAILLILIFLAAIVVVAFFRLKSWYWVPGLLVLFSLITATQTVSAWVLIPFWALLIIATLFMALPPLRLRFFSAPVLNYIRKVLPPLSETERAAIEIGDVCWEGELFSGHPNWEKFLQSPAPKLSDEEQHFLDHQVEILCTMINDWQIQCEHQMPEALWDYLKKEGFFGLVINKRYGGLGFSAIAHSAVINKLSSRSVTVAVHAMVPNSLGPGELIERYGTEEQKNHYLPRLARGEEIPCFGLTSEDVGSDATALTDQGVVCRGLHEGKEVFGIRLNWRKRYITLAPIATLVSIAFFLRDPDHLLGEQDNIGITLALIPAQHEGVEIGHRHYPAYLAFLNGPCSGKDVFIPLEWIIGGREQVGQGWRMLVTCLSLGRSISLPSLSTANAKINYRMAGAYARIREQFRRPIGHFEGIQEALARIGGGTYLLEASRVVTAGLLDQGLNPAIISAIVKYHSTEWSRQITNDSLDIHAGRGIQAGPRNYLMTSYLAVPIGITVEGANILTRSLMIFGQGALRCHPYLFEEMNCAQSDDPNRVKHFDRILLQHLSHFIFVRTRTWVYGISCGRLASSPVPGSMARYYRQLNRMSSAFAFISDVTLILLGGQLKCKEHLSARLGDILSHLYLASTTLKFFYDQGSNREDEDHVAWVLETCLQRIQVAFDDFFHNFPFRKISKVLRFILFPYGCAYAGPSDALSSRLALSMLQPSALKDRLTQPCFIPNDRNDPIGRMEYALKAIIQAQAAYDKLHDALKKGRLVSTGSFEEQLAQAATTELLTAEEITSLREAEQARADAIKVDDFQSIPGELPK